MLYLAIPLLSCISSFLFLFPTELDAANSTSAEVARSPLPSQSPIIPRTIPAPAIHHHLLDLHEASLHHSHHQQRPWGEEASSAPGPFLTITPDPTPTYGLAVYDPRAVLLASVAHSSGGCTFAGDDSEPGPLRLTEDTPPIMTDDNTTTNDRTTANDAGHPSVTSGSSSAVTTPITSDNGPNSGTSSSSTSSNPSSDSDGNNLDAGEFNNRRRTRPVEPPVGPPIAEA
ncbi:hypothetical protein VTJ04DRAFT_4212 [Mycothermus thermophilus]|uniref:uncharacterized protein n=1 Tax=Humicola insolens TaxID=85995 RepID=UPI003743CB75